MTTGSRTPDILDQLVARLRATTGYRSPFAAGAASAGVPVYDSGELALQNPGGVDFLAFGYANTWPLPQGPVNFPAAQMRSTSAPGPLGTPRTRQDEGSVDFTVVAQSGAGGERRDFVVKGIRDRARGHLDVLDAALRTPFDGPTLGITATHIVCQLGALSWSWGFDSGVYWRVSGSVTYTSRV